MTELTKLSSVYVIMGNHDYRQEYDNEIGLLSDALVYGDKLIKSKIEAK